MSLGGDVVIGGGGVVDIAYSPDGHLLLAANGQFAKLWKANVPGDDPVVFKNVSSVAFNHDGSRFAGTGYRTRDTTVHIRDSERGEVVLSIKPSNAPWGIAFDRKGEVLATGTVDGVLQLWDAETGVSLSSPLPQHQSSIRRIAFGVASKRVVTASHDRTARVWHVATGRTIGPPMRHSGPVKAVAVSRDGKRIITGDGDGEVWVWKMPPLPIFRNIDRVKLWVQIATGMELDDGRVRVLDADVWREQRALLEEEGDFAALSN